MSGLYEAHSNTDLSIAVIEKARRIRKKLISSSCGRARVCSPWLRWEYAKSWYRRRVEEHASVRLGHDKSTYVEPFLIWRSITHIAGLKNREQWRRVVLCRELRIGFFFKLFVGTFSCKNCETKKWEHLGQKRLVWLSRKCLSWRWFSKVANTSTTTLFLLDASIPMRVFWNPLYILIRCK